MSSQSLKHRVHQCESDIAKGGEGYHTVGRVRLYWFLSRGKIANSTLQLVETRCEGPKIDAVRASIPNDIFFLIHFIVYLVFLTEIHQLIGEKRII